MFKQNKYTKYYFNIIEKAKIRIMDDSYYENHHIIPKCLGGSNKKSNLVKLTAKEHFIVHMLLTKMNDDNRLKYALHAMSIINPKQKDKRYKIKSSSIYEYIKKCNSQATSERMKCHEGYLLNKIKYRNKFTGVYKFFEKDYDVDMDIYDKGWGDEFKEHIGLKNKDRIYYYDKKTGEVKTFFDGDTIPKNFQLGNPHAGKGSIKIFKGSKYFYDPITGDEQRFKHDKSIPYGWVEGRSKKWITNGILNKQINMIVENIPNGWIEGRTINHGDKIKKSREKHITTPLGDFTHPIRFCEKYDCDLSLFDNLDSVLRKRKSNFLLINELEMVGYDFNKTKKENGFYFK